MDELRSFANSSGSLPAQSKIGFVGLGRMGTAMAANLAAVGRQVIAYVRQPDRMPELIALGLMPTIDITDLFDCNVVVSMLPNDDAVLDASFGGTVLGSLGFAVGLRRGAIHLSMSTIGTTTASHLAREHARHGQGYVAAPVFGNPDAGDSAACFYGHRTLPGIKDGTSNTIMYAERYRRCNLDPAGNQLGCLWAHGDWAYPWMAMFAYGSSDGTRGYATGTNLPWAQLPPGNVGPGSKFQVAPLPALTQCDYTRAQSPHNSGMNVGLADGSVRTLSAGISPTTWWIACTPNGGDILGSDW